jgi:hypothetical protein
MSTGDHYEDIGRYFTNSGWECPKCRNVMSPTQPFCLFCSAALRQEKSVKPDSALDVTATSGSIRGTLRNENNHSGIERDKQSNSTS